MEKELHTNFEQNYNKGLYEDANVILLKELSKLIVEKKRDFVFLLNECGIEANERMSDAQLINLFIDNVGINKQLSLGASLLINMNNRKSSFDGGDFVNDKSVKSMYYVLNDNFSNAVGLGQAIAGAVQGVAGSVNTGLNLQRQKKHGAIDTLQKQQEARVFMQQQANELRREKLMADAKQKLSDNKIIIIAVGGTILLAGIIITVVYLKRRKK